MFEQKTDWGAVFEQAGHPVRNLTETRAHTANGAEPDIVWPQWQDQDAVTTSDSAKANNQKPQGMYEAWLNNPGNESLEDAIALIRLHQSHLSDIDLERAARTFLAGYRLHKSRKVVQDSEG
jgi:hypothetical protein